jgi:hypothetical protein
MGITNQPMGMTPQTQSTLQAPLQLPQNPQPQLCPQLPAQPHPNPNNRPTQLVQIIENVDGEINFRRVQRTLAEVRAHNFS